MPRRGDPGFDADVVRLVVNDLRSVWALEVLLQMRDDPGRPWTIERLTQNLRANVAMMEDIVRRLGALGLVVPDGEGYVFRPDDEQLVDLVDRTHAAYRQKPFAMISLIGRGAGALHDLADAFRVKGDWE